MTIIHSTLLCLDGGHGVGTTTHADALAVALRALAAARPPKGTRWSVTMTREGRGVLDEDCGLNASLKHVRDAVGEWLGTGDAPSAPVAWRYAQTRTQSYAVVVRVEALT